MAFIEYTYSIVNDTLNGEVNLTTLTDEIKADPLASVGFKALRLEEVQGLVNPPDPQDVYVGYDPALDGAGQTALDAVLAAHDGAPAPLEDALVVDSDVDFLGNALSGVGTLNGVGFDGFVSDTTTHIGRTDNPHATDIGSLGTGTLAELNSKVTDATLDDSSDPRDPNSHAATHSSGGSDPISHDNLAGLTTGDPHTQYLNSARFDTEFSGKTTTDLTEGTNLYYTEGRVSANVSVASNTTHQGRTDNPHATDIGNLGTGTLAELNSKVTDATLDDSSDPRDPNAHAASHNAGGVDELLAQNLGSGAEAAGQILETDGTGGYNLVPNAVVVTDHGNLLGLGDDDHTQYLLEDGTRALSGDLNVGGNDVTNVGLVDGVDVSVLSTTTTNHIADTANPHATDIGNLGTGTLAELNSKVTDATLDDSSDPRDPNSHASTHEEGGSDELTVQNLGSGAAGSGLLLETDGTGGFTLITTPVVVTDHGGLTGLGDDDHTQYLLADGTRALSGDLDLGTNDVTNVGLVDGIDVSAQAATTNAHIADTANPHGTDIGNLGSGTLAELNTKITDATLDDSSDPRDPNSHAATHSSGGTDPISHNDLGDLTVGDPHTQYTTEVRSRAAAPVQPTTGAPSNAIGQDGDLAIDADNGDLYEKDTGTWTASSLIGPEGPPGFGLGAYARTSSAGSIIEARGLTVTRTANGRYEYLFTQPAADTNYVVIGQPIGTVTDTNIQIPAANIAVGGFRLEIGVGDNSSTQDILTDREHTVIVLGDGIQGPGGITSAYESWLNSGNTGTEADFIADLVGPAGAGFPAGGVTGEVLAKLSNTDFDTDWITLTASDVGADPAGTAATAVANHVAEADPHTQYVNSARFDTEFASKDTDDLSEGGSNLYYTEGRVTANTDVAANTAHRNATGNPHSTTPADIGAIPATEKGAVNGVATLDGTGKIPTAQIPASALPTFDVVADIPARDALVVQEGDEAFVTSTALFYIYDGAAWFERPSSAGMVSNSGGSTDNAIARFDGATGQIIQNSSATLDDAGNLTLAGDLDVSNNDIIDVGDINGTNFNTFVGTTNTHIADTANPHGTDIGNLGSGTLAELNSKVTDATLDDASDPRDPNSHASSHEIGGTDVVVAQNLSSDAALVNQILETDGAGGFVLIPTPVVITDHGTLLGLEDDDHLQYLLTDGTRTLTGDLDVGGNDILNVGDVDGVDISAQAATTNAHIGNTANPHGTDIGNLGSGTLAELNSKVTDATLDDVTGTRDPNSHGASHEEGGSDELTVQNLGSGAAAASLTLETDGAGGWNLVTPATVITDHGALTGLGDDDHTQYLLEDGTRALSGDLDLGTNDVINVGLVDGIDVSAQATTTNNHIADTANPHGTDIGNLGTGTLAELNSKVTDATLDDSSDPRDPNSHASTHIEGGSDVLDGDKLEIDFTPLVYVPDASISESDNTSQLSSHLKGIDSSLQSALVFGSNLVVEESLAASTTTVANSFVQKLRLTITVTAANAGTYRLDWSYFWNFDNQANDFRARIQEDDTTTLMEQRQEPKDSAGSGIGGTNQRFPAAGTIVRTLTPGTYDYDLDYTTSSGDEASIFDARMIMHRIL